MSERQELRPVSMARAYAIAATVEKLGFRVPLTAIKAVENVGEVRLQMQAAPEMWDALLNHTTKEQAEEHILTQLDRWHSCNGWDPPEKVAFVMTLVARLFPEEAPTDSQAGGSLS